MSTPGDGQQSPEQPPQQPSWETGQQFGRQETGGQYGQGLGSPAYYAAPDHPKALTALVLGVLGVAFCGVLGPFAWVIGKRSVDEIDASHGRLGGRIQAQAGYVLGIVATVLLVLGVLTFIAWITFVGIVLGGSFSVYD